jgi:hypothetical protein
MGTGAWGEGSWGAGSWGGGPGAGIQFIDIVAIRENAIRLEFDQAVNLTALLSFDDASRPDLWSVTASPFSTGLSGDPARAVRIVRIELAGAEDGVADIDYGRFVNLILDRPMTAFPAVYSVTWIDIFAKDLLSQTSGSSDVYAVYRLLEQPQIQVPKPSRDFANPQTTGAAIDSLPRPNAPFALGSFGVDDTGDYAMDEGTVNLKKRIIRRLITRKGAFAHLPNYGVGVPDQAKKLGQAIVISKLKAEAEVQIAQEPDVLQSRVIVVVNSDTPNLVRFRVAVKSKVGKPIAFEVPFDIAA